MATVATSSTTEQLSSFNPATGERNYAIVQAEDEIASIGMVTGAGCFPSPAAAACVAVLDGCFHSPADAAFAAAADGCFPSRLVAARAAPLLG